MKNPVLTIRAMDDEEDNYYQEGIDVFAFSIALEPNKTSRSSVVNGTNDIAIFNISYYIQYINGMKTYACSAESAMKVSDEISPSVMSTPAIDNLPNNEACLEAANVSAALSPWTAVAVLFIIFTAVFSISTVFLACFVYRKRAVIDSNGIQKHNTEKKNSGNKENTDLQGNVSCILHTHV